MDREFEAVFVEAFNAQEGAQNFVVAAADLDDAALGQPDDRDVLGGVVNTGQ